MEICLPADKLQNLRRLTHEWKGRRVGQKRDMLSLIGYLSHACKAVRQGGSFLRRLINVANSVQHIDHYVCLNAAAQSDIHWWHQYAASWYKMPNHNNPDAHITSDAAENGVCGAFSGKEWFQLQWSSSTNHHHNITIKE